MKVLLSCYACSPFKGSEPGMGWNFVNSLSKYHELYVISEGKFQQDIEQYYSEHPQEKTNIHFYFIWKKRHKKLRKLWPPSYYWFYNAWQEKAANLAVLLDKQYDFDIVHQLNMIGYRSPGFLYRLNKPLVWGPVGGFNIIPWRLLPSMGVYGAAFYTFRNLINLLQMNCSSMVSKMVKNADAIICATNDDAKSIKRLWNRTSYMITEVGLSNINEISVQKKKDDILNICWSGVNEPRKSLNLLLDSMLKCKSLNHIHLDVIGDGKCHHKWMQQAKKDDIEQYITWHGCVERKKAIQVMQQADVFAITSLSDATSTVLLEALSMGLPILTLNHLGFAGVVNDTCGIKIDISTHKKITNDFAKAIDYIYNNKNYRLELSEGAKKRALDFRWEDKASLINKIYKSIVK